MLGHTRHDNTIVVQLNKIPQRQHQTTAFTIQNNQLIIKLCMGQGLFGQTHAAEKRYRMIAEIILFPRPEEIRLYL